LEILAILDLSLSWLLKVVNFMSIKSSYFKSLKTYLNLLLVALLSGLTAVELSMVNHGMLVVIAIGPLRDFVRIVAITLVLLYLSGELIKFGVGLGLKIIIYLPVNFIIYLVVEYLDVLLLRAFCFIINFLIFLLKVCLKILIEFSFLQLISARNNFHNFHFLVSDLILLLLMAHNLPLVLY